MNAEDMMLPADDHPCVIEFERDPMAWREQYIVHCACHDGLYGRFIWQPGDPVIKCKGCGNHG